jgi:PDZ domain-containing secreted protein
VIKAINGHPVNSEQEAISFIKNNKDKYDVWEVEIENKGKTKIVTYKVPKKK